MLAALVAALRSLAVLLCVLLRLKVSIAPPVSTFTDAEGDRRDPLVAPFRRTTQRTA